MLKRPFDIALSATALVVLSPVLACVSALLAIFHWRPIIFSQVRVGKCGSLFRIHKFRTMNGATGPAVTAGSDPRIHRIGHFLRSTKLDELPQFWDVLCGHMSLVGPRPEVPEYVNRWPARERDIILSVRPGITDPASVRFRDEAAALAGSEAPEQYYIETIMPLKLAMYVDYVQHRSWVSDLAVLARTALAVVSPPIVGLLRLDGRPGTGGTVGSRNYGYGVQPKYKWNRSPDRAGAGIEDPQLGTP